MKGGFILLVLSAAVFLFLSGCGIQKEMDTFVKEGIISTPDLKQIEDGDYTGRYRSGVVSVKIKVSVQDHKITALEIIRHFNGQGKKAEIITEAVINAQSLDVDIVSGATYSSKVILKAVENALTGR